jgi:hypothetical protein
MKTITDTAEIKNALTSFEPVKTGAYPTNRLVVGASSAMDPQEWAERGTIDGVPATVYYMFDEDETDHEDGGDYPFDLDHVTYIEIGDDE